MHRKTLAALAAMAMLYLSSAAFAIAAPPVGEAQGEAATSPLTPDEAKIMLTENQPGIPLEVISIKASPVAGLWEVSFDVNGKKYVVYIDSAKRFIIAGNMIDSTDMSNLTQARISELERVDFASIDLTGSVVLGDPKAKYQVVVFDDPD